MQGYKATDNSYFAFLEEVRLRPQNLTYFITKNKSEIKRLNSARVIYAYSVRGICCQLLAEQVFFSHSIFDFISPLVIGGKITNLQHGYVIKMLDQRFPTKLIAKNHLLKKTFLLIFPHIYPYYSHYLAGPGGLFMSSARRAYGLSEPQPVIDCYPRIKFLRRNQIEKKQRIAIMVALTFSRKECIKTRMKRILPDEPNRLLPTEQIGSFHFVFRPHPLEAERLEVSDLPIGWSLDLEYTSSFGISEYDLLITDVSSIAFDAMQLGIPVFFLQTEVQRYQQDDVGLDPLVLEAIRKYFVQSVSSALDTFRQIQKEHHRKDFSEKQKRDFFLS